MTRNTDLLGIKLGKLIPNSIQKCEAKFEKAIKIIADNVAVSILNEDYEHDNEFSEALEDCEDCARTCDAADNLLKYVFYNEDCNSLKKHVSIKTIECSRWNYDFKEFRNKIEGIFSKEGLDTQKGFVYIFWSAVPAEFFYVGKTNPKNNKTGLQRFKEDRHSSLVQSSKEATRLTIIYPYPNKDDSINDVEASIIRIIGIDNLTYNDKEEPFTEDNSELSKRLSELKEFLNLESK
ncbi:MAG: hypothetical protein LBH25_11495 [Fibromonadaceae bacterium]|jgi:hypothetical protein|nr:hypothetical protein [Fibromonadaceae bacterium]